MKEEDIIKLLKDKIEKSTPKELKEALEFFDMVEVIRQQAKKEVFDDNGCHVEGAIAKALEEYGVRNNRYDMAFFIMKRLREEYNSSNTDKTLKGLKEFREKNWDKTLPLNEAYKKYIKIFEGKPNSLTTEKLKEGENGD